MSDAVLVIALVASPTGPSGRSRGLSEARLARLERRVDALAVRGGTGSESAPDDVSDGEMREVLDLLGDGKKIDAIKLYRQMTGVGLAEAKDAVESMADGRASGA